MQQAHQQQQAQQHGVALTSQHFPIDDTLDAHLVLRAKGARAAPGRSLRVLIEGRQATGPAAPLECRLSAQAEVTKLPGERRWVGVIQRGWAGACWEWGFEYPSAGLFQRRPAVL